MDLTLYNAPMLTGSVIQTDIEAYLSYCEKHVITIPEIVTLDDMTIDVKTTYLPGRFIPSYAQFGRHETVDIRYYYITAIEHITPSTVRLTLSRDYIHEHFNINHRVYGQYVEGHLPLTSDTAYSLPVPDGNVMGIKRNRPILPSGLGAWGADGKFGYVFRVVLSRAERLTGSKVVLISSREYDTFSNGDFLTMYNVLSSANKLNVKEAAETSPETYDIEEITNVWLVPEGFMPPAITNYTADFAYSLAESQATRFNVCAPAGRALTVDIAVYVPTYSNVKTVVGNNLVNIELPHSDKPYPVTVIGLYSVDSMLTVTLRANGRCVDLTPSFDLGSNLFSNSSATLSGKISRGIGILTGTIGIASGVATGNAIGIAGSAISTISSATSGIGGRTAVSATGADGLQIVFNDTVIGSDSGYASSRVGGLYVAHLSLDNGDNITDTMHLFGVQTNSAYRDKLGGLVSPDNVTYARFDNVRVMAGDVPPQYRAQLTDALTRGVHISDIHGIPSYILTWVGDVDAL